jgi:hypothetical protein
MINLLTETIKRYNFMQYLNFLGVPKASCPLLQAILNRKTVCFHFHLYRRT